MKFKRIIKTIKHLMDPLEGPENLLKEVQDSRKELIKLKGELKYSSHWKTQYSSVLDTMTEAMKALVWKKDINNRYLLASPLHCQHFFGISATAECLKYIEGRTDFEIIEELFTSKNIMNSFGKTCMISDQYALENKVICHFFEGGIIDGDQVLLYIVKTPQFCPNGNVMGTVGVAWDFTDQSKTIIQLLNKWIKQEKAVELHRENDVFAYLVTPEAQKCDIFSHICPKPAECTILKDKVK